MPHLCSTTDKFWLSLSWPDLMMWLFSLGHCRGHQQEIKNNSETYFHEIWSYYQTSSILVGLLPPPPPPPPPHTHTHTHPHPHPHPHPPHTPHPHPTPHPPHTHTHRCQETIHHRGVSSRWSNIWHSYELISDFDLLGPSVLLHVQFFWDHGQTWIL